MASPHLSKFCLRQLGEFFQKPRFPHPSMKHTIFRAGILALGLHFLLGCNGENLGDFQRVSSGLNRQMPTTKTPSSQTSKEKKILPIQPVVQDKQVWCWLACGEMIFKYYGVPSANPLDHQKIESGSNDKYQCGIMGILMGPNHPCWSNCEDCIFPAGLMENIVEMLRRYPPETLQMFKNYGIQMPGFYGDLRSAIVHSPLSESAVRHSINNGLPLIAGVNRGAPPPRASEHVCLVIGYDVSDSGEFLIIVNDPYPYNPPNSPHLPNPYISAGGVQTSFLQYVIPLDRFVSELKCNLYFELNTPVH